MCILFKEETKEYAHVASNNNNKVTIVKDINQATEISDEIANKLMSKCSKKLKGFKKVKAKTLIENVLKSDKADEPEAPEKIKKNEPEKEIKETKDEAEKTARRAFTPEEREKVYVRDKGICQICGKFISPNDYTIDHIVPLARGGSYDMSNLQCCCKKCNQAKADFLPNEYFRKILEIVNYQINKGNIEMKKDLHKIIKKYNKNQKKTR